MKSGNPLLELTRNPSSPDLRGNIKLFGLRTSNIVYSDGMSDLWSSPGQFRRFFLCNYSIPIPKFGFAEPFSSNLHDLFFFMGKIMQKKRRVIEDYDFLMSSPAQGPI